MIMVEDELKSHRKEIDSTTINNLKGLKEEGHERHLKAREYPYELLPRLTIRTFKDVPVQFVRKLVLVKELNSFRHQGLYYVHTGPDGGIFHRDVKSTNILLDEHYVAKVAEFGLSQSGMPDPDHISTCLKGSFGYVDPENFRTLHLTNKSDVYSFGVILLEVLCARPPIVNSKQRVEINLAEWGMFWQKEGQLEKIIDPLLVGHINRNSLRKFGEIAEKCLKPRGADRPNMLDVCWDLEYALQLQQTPTHREAHEDNPTTAASTDLTLPPMQNLSYNMFPIDDYSDTIASTMFSQLRVNDST
ncbi:hypothetical protein DKX38_007900 [Salix brachista]|uniref:Protein kinase domain-containing protein n=1 Tax=Salix brachista TaxID=2182728 RepID=A0A5N5MS07_9ROSI|nr:hypothetical protein DKX38_007900 [Salix brachista]